MNETERERQFNLRIETKRHRRLFKHNKWPCPVTNHDVDPDHLDMILTHFNSLFVGCQNHDFCNSCMYNLVVTLTYPNPLPFGSNS